MVEIFTSMWNSAFMWKMRAYWKFLLPVLFLCSCSEVKTNTWEIVSRNEFGARRHSSFRWAEDAGAFLLWGYMGHVTEFYGNPDEPFSNNLEYDIVAFFPESGEWTDHLPLEKEEEWSRELPPLHQCSSYQGITIGSHRPQLKVREGILRPDLNILFDQVTYDGKRSRMVYFTGGRTFAYDVAARKWSDIGKGTAPPPVLGGSLCYDPVNDEVLLTGGGHVAEIGPEGKPVGHVGTWVYECESSTWRPLGNETEPPPRIASRLVSDTKNRLLVLFGGDGLSHYLGDTWIYETERRTWRRSKASGPSPRAGHFTVYDPRTGWVLIGGGYNRQDLSDMWAFDAAADQWLKLKADVPTGWHIAADIKPDEGLILLTTSSKVAGDTMHCNEIYSVRTTYAFRLDPDQALIEREAVPAPEMSIPKRSVEEATEGTRPDPERRQKQAERLKSMPDNQWLLLSDPGRVAPTRSWGSCSFDADQGRIVYWGGGHCGYGGGDYDFYDVAENTWISSPVISEYPERAWDKSGGVYPAGLTFTGAPWMRHGRKAYAYDPVSRKIVNMKYIYLTAGYEPEFLRDYFPQNPDFGRGEEFERSGYAKWVTWTYDPEAEEWEIVCPCNPGLDLMVSTPRGVMAVDYYWRAVNTLDRPDAVIFQGKKVVENAVFLLDVEGREWKKLSTSGPWPQNLYELTALVYDSRRNRLLLHGGGAQRDELWEFRIGSGLWKKLEPAGSSPVCRREAVYLPKQDLFFTLGSPAANSEQVGIHVYSAAENTWRFLDIGPPQGKDLEVLLSQNRAVTYDPSRDLILMVLGERNADDAGQAQVYALRIRANGS